MVSPESGHGGAQAQNRHTAAAIEHIRRAEGLGVSEAVNRLIRRALLRDEELPTFRQRTRPLGLKIDVSDVAGALDVLEGPEAR